MVLWDICLTLIRFKARLLLLNDCSWVVCARKAFKLSNVIRFRLEERNMVNSKIGAFSVISLLLLSFVVGLGGAQYDNGIPSNYTIGSDGTATVNQSENGITYLIHGVSGSTGTVYSSVHNGNPQATAAVSDGISLNYFVTITFDMAPSDFIEAEITISYSDSDVANLDQPYSVYKYLPSTDTYVQLFTTVDTSAKTMTIVLTGVDDPLLAIGGSTVENPGFSSTSWVIIGVSVAIIVVLAVFLVFRWRKM